MSERKDLSVEQQFDLITEMMEQIFTAVKLLADSVKQAQEADTELEKGVIDIKKSVDSQREELGFLLKERAKKNEIENAQLGALFNKGTGLFGGRVTKVSEQTRKALLKDLRKTEDLAFQDFLKEVASGRLGSFAVRHRLEKTMRQTDQRFC